jgi:hypothetical protein
VWTAVLSVLGCSATTCPPPPPPPPTYRVVQPNGAVIDLGDGKKPKVESAKQEGCQALFEYDDGSGDKVKIDGTLFKPGDPNPAPLNDGRVMLDAPSDPLALQSQSRALNCFFLRRISRHRPRIFPVRLLGNHAARRFQGEEDFSYADGSTGAITITAISEPFGPALLVTVYSDHLLTFAYHSDSFGYRTWGRPFRTAAWLPPGAPPRHGQRLRSTQIGVFIKREAQ